MTQTSRKFVSAGTPKPAGETPALPGGFNALSPWARDKFLPADRNHREVCIYRGIYTEKENGVGLQLWGAHAPSRVGVGALADASFCFIETTDITGWHG